METSQIFKCLVLAVTLEEAGFRLKNGINDEIQDIQAMIKKEFSELADQL